MSHRFTRRQFIHSSLAIAGAGVALSGTKGHARVIGANDRINIAVAGINGRGGSHIGEYLGMKDVQIAYIIDPDSRLFPSRTKTIEDKGKYKVAAVQDFRKALDDPNLDAISIATCNHWHSPMSIFAVMAGKDVYVEKPVSHNLREGRILVELARKNNRIVQHGTQGRASTGYAKLAEIGKNGSLGKVLVSRGLCYKGRGSIGVKEHEEPPAGVDFNLWLGPAPQQPYHKNLVHYNWHWFWDFGNGDIGNQGVHEMDKARWIAGVELPQKVFSLGARFGYKDQGQTPNTQIVFFDYGPDKPMLIFEVRGLRTNPYKGQGVGNVTVFEKGTVSGDKDFTPTGGEKKEPLPAAEGKRGPGGQFQNFIHVMRTRNRAEQHADVLEGHYSAALIHMANISYRLGEEVPFSQKSKTLGDNKEAVETFERMCDHLKTNSVLLDESKYRMGRVLSFDAKAEQFVGDAEANRMLTREYRAPFQIPERVV